MVQLALKLCAGGLLQHFRQIRKKAPGRRASLNPNPTLTLATMCALEDPKTQDKGEGPGLGPCLSPEITCRLLEV